MRFVVGNNITIHGATKELIDYANSELTLVNPEYAKKQNMGLYCGNVPKYIYLYQRISDKLILPFGVLDEIWKRYKDTCIFERDISDLRRVNYDLGINLYDYQLRALNSAYKRKNGILVMPCGSGKTNVGLALICAIGGRALWLTHTQDLLTQSLNRAKAIINLPTTSYGTITAGKVNIGESITFATVQTMAKLDLQKYRNCFDIIIVDECQHCAGSPTKVTQFYKVLDNLSARYKYGLTATPYRADGLEKSMYAILGDIVAEVPKEEVASNTCDVIVKKYKTTYSPNLDVVLSGDGTLNYGSLVKDITSDDERFNYVLDVLNTLNKPIICLANRVEYLDRLNSAYKGKSVCMSKFGNSKSAKIKREKCIEDLRNGELDCIFATYQLCKEGIDVPNLNNVVFATPEKDKTTIIQSSGRVGRKADGKAYGAVIDFVDDFPYLRGASRKRDAIYKKLDYKIFDYEV